MENGGRRWRWQSRCWWIATVGGCGFVPRMPGTAGALLAVFFFVAGWFLAVWAADWAGDGAADWAGGGAGGSAGGSAGGRSGGASSTSAGSGAEPLALGSPPPLLLAGYVGLLVVGLGAGVWAAGRAERELGCPDDPRIVIDEVVGQWIALAPLALVHFGTAKSLFSFSCFVVTGFVLFRLFDIWKPGPVGWAERRFEGGLGVMADDVVAGGLAAACLTGLLVYV